MTVVLSVQVAYCWQIELPEYVIAEPVHPSNFAQVSRFTTALGKPIP